MISIKEKDFKEVSTQEIINNEIEMVKPKKTPKRKPVKPKSRRRRTKSLRDYILGR